MGWKWRTVGEACERLDVLDEEEARTETALLRLEDQPIAQERKAEIRTSLSMALVVMARGGFRSYFLSLSRKTKKGLQGTFRNSCCGQYIKAPPRLMCYSLLSQPPYLAQNGSYSFKPCTSNSRRSLFWPEGVCTFVMIMAARLESTYPLIWVSVYERA